MTTEEAKRLAEISTTTIQDIRAIRLKKIVAGTLDTVKNPVTFEPTWPRESTAKSCSDSEISESGDDSSEEYPY